MTVPGPLQSIVDGFTATTSTLGSALDTVLNRRQLDSNNPNLDQSEYDFNYRAFPEDLGSDYSSHYMVININVPVNAGGVVRGNYYGSRGEGGDFTGRILSNEYSKVDNLRFNPASSPISSLNIGPESELYAPQRSTRRIAESIALYMPSPMIYNQLNVYEEVSLTSIMGQAGKLAAIPIGSAIGAATAAFVRRTIEAARRGESAGGNLVDSIGNVIGTGFALAGYPINPRIEVLFSNTTQRQFNFEFLMAPRSENESKIMQNIIRTLRFHAAPEIDSFSVGGIGIPTYIPPAEFDITFYNGAQENLSIPRVNTCVLERCEVDYAPTGAWSTFSNGQPVAARLLLSFREVEIVHKRRVVQGF